MFMFKESCLTLCEAMDYSIPGFPVLYHPTEFAQTQVHWVSDAIQPSHPLSFPSPPAFNLSQHQGLFQWVSLCIRWPTYWSFSFSPSNEYSGLISFRIDCFDLLAIQGSVKSLLQHIEHLYASAHPSVPNTFEASCFFFFLNKVFGFLFLFFIYLFFYLFVFYYTGYSCSTLSSCGKTGLLFIGVLGLLNTVASLVAEHRL